MRFLLFIPRLIFGLVFMASGFLKLLDPVGTGLIVGEYLNAAHLSILSSLAVPCGIVLSISELIIGISILMGLRMKVVSLIGLCLTSFFTILTLILALFNPIQDCGCFGEAVHLTNWQTFYKNVVLMVCILIIFIFRGRHRRVARAAAEWAFLGFFAIVALMLSIHTLLNIPMADFGNFKDGSNISVKLDDATQGVEVNVKFVYEKDGERKEFDIEQIPDSTWTFVESIDLSKYSETAHFDFSIKDAEGYYITDWILTTPKPVFIVTVTDTDILSSIKRWERLEALADSVTVNDGVFIVATASTAEHIASIAREMDRNLQDSLSLRFCYSDYKTLISMNRSNGGVMYMNDAIVVKKWPADRLTANDINGIISQDPEAITAKSIIKQQLISELSFVFILLSIIIFRYVCGIIYERRPNNLLE